MAKFWQRQDRNTAKQEATTDASLTGPYCSLQHLMAQRWAARNMALPKAKRVSRPQAGQHRSRFRGRGMEFSEVRTYQPGDDVRSIDWRVTARRQKPHTKLFNEERERPILIVCDQSQSQFFGSQVAFKSVRAAEAAALFAWSALEHNDRVGGIVFSEQGHQEVRPARSRKSILRLLNTIVDYNNALSIDTITQSGGFQFNDAMSETARLARPGTLIIIVSDFRHIDEETERQLSKMARHNELLMVRTFDPVEEQLPPPGSYPVSNGDDTLIIDAKSADTRQRYRAWAQSQREKIIALSRKYRAPFAEITTRQSPLAALQGLLISVGK